MEAGAVSLAGSSRSVPPPPPAKTGDRLGLAALLRTERDAVPGPANTPTGQRPAGTDRDAGLLSAVRLAVIALAGDPRPAGSATLRRLRICTRSDPTSSRACSF